MPSNKALTNMMSLFTRHNPLTHTVIIRRSSHTPSTTTNNQVARPVLWVRTHALDDAAVDNGVGGDITCLTLGQRPADSFPTAVFLQVHAAEGEVLHYVPGDDAHAVYAVVELQDVVDAAFGRSGVEVLVEMRVWGFAVVQEDSFVVRVARDSTGRDCVAVGDRGRGGVDFDGWDVVVGVATTTGHGVFVAAAQGF